MSNLLEHARSNRAFDDVKSALREIGCSVCDNDDLQDIARTIRKECVTGPNAVVNATLAAGPGIKITPIDRKGYKISANDEAPITSDIHNDLPKGTSIHKALYKIVNSLIPGAIKTAVHSPAIVDIEIFKVHYDGIDYFNNKYFGNRGQGRKTGLQPDEWYLKIYTVAQIEPLYVGLGAAFEDYRRSILCEMNREMDKKIRFALKKYHERVLGDIIRPPHHHRPGHCGPCKPHHKPYPKPDDSFGGFDPDDNFGVTPEPEIPEPELPEGPTVIEQPIDPSRPLIEEGTGDCPICNPDTSFGGFDDDDFNVEPEIENEWDIEDEDGNVTETIPGEDQDSLEKFIKSL